MLRGQNGIGHDSLFKFTQVPSKHFIGLSFGQPFFSGHIESLSIQEPSGHNFWFSLHSSFISLQFLKSETHSPFSHFKGLL